MDFAKLLVDRFSQRSIKDKLKLLAYAAALGVVILTVIFLFRKSDSYWKNVGTVFVVVETATESRNTISLSRQRASQ